jgi:hypothetical protein
MKTFIRQADEYSVSKKNGLQQRKCCILKDEFVLLSKE